MSERETELGAYEHARKLVDEQRKEQEQKLQLLRDYIDRRNKHRVEAIDQVGEFVKECYADLRRGEEKPGWVHTRLKSVEAASQATAATLKWQNRLLVGTLLGLLANLIDMHFKGGL